MPEPKYADYRAFETVKSNVADVKKDLKSIEISLGERLRTSELDLATVKADVKAIKRLAYIAIPLLSAAVFGAFTWCLTTSIAVGKIAQNLSDHGNPIVSQILKPSSPLALQASLLSVAAEAQKAKLQGKKATEKTLALSEAVNGALRENAAVPEAWEAAAQLVSFRMQQGGEEGVSCFDPSRVATPIDVTEEVKKWPPEMRATLHHKILLHDCALDLSDDVGFVALPEVQRNIFVPGTKVVAPIWLDLLRVHVRYRGGKLLPVGTIRFVQCSADFELGNAPQTAPARRMTSELLVAKNSADVVANVRAS